MDSVQSKIKENYKPFSGGKIGLFAKKCKCKYCGYTLKTSKSHNDRYLRCPTRQVDKSSCQGSFISENVVKKVVLKEINSLTEQYLNIDQLEENIILKQFRNEKEELKKEIAKHQVIIDNQSRAIKVSYMDKINGIISEEQFIEFNSDFSRNIEEQKKIIANKKLKLAELENEQETLKSKRELLQKYVNVTELTREMIDNLIDYIEVGAKDPITKKKTIEIHWKI